MNPSKYSNRFRKLLDNSPRQNWATIQRKLSSKQKLETFDDSHPSIFVLSTGRVGSETMAELLKYSPNVFVYHEPPPHLFSLSYLAYKYEGEEMSHQIFRESWKAARNERLQYALSCGRGYIETSPQVTFLAPWILQSVPNAKFIHLIRNPLDVIRSGMRRKWYTGIQSDVSRITPQPDSPFIKEWNNFSPVQRNMWLWAETNRWIENFCQTLSEKQHLFLRSEEVFRNDRDTIERLFNFAGANVLAQYQIQKVLSKRLNQQTTGEFSQADILEGNMNVRLNEFIADVAGQAGYEWVV